MVCHNVSENFWNDTPLSWFSASIWTLSYVDSDSCREVYCCFSLTMDHVPFRLVCYIRNTKDYVSCIIIIFILFVYFQYFTSSRLNKGYTIVSFCSITRLSHSVQPRWEYFHLSNNSMNLTFISLNNLANRHILTGLKSPALLSGNKVKLYAIWMQ